MDSLHPAHPGHAAALQSALDQLWIRFLPDIKDRISILESAAAAAAAGSLPPEQQQAAQSAAHKLVGILGTFGLDQGTFPARETERLYTADAAPSSQAAGQLVSFAKDLRLLVESRQPSSPPEK